MDLKAELDRRRPHVRWLRVLGGLPPILGVGFLGALLKPGDPPDGYDPPTLAIFLIGSALVLLAIAIWSVWWYLAGREVRNRGPGAAP